MVGLAQMLTQFSVENVAETRSSLKQSVHFCVPLLGWEVQIYSPLWSNGLGPRDSFHFLVYHAIGNASVNK